MKTGNYTVKVNSGKIAIQAAQSIELKVAGSTVKIEPAAITRKCGGSTIKVEPAGITLQGVQLKIQGNATVDIKAAMTSVGGDGMLKLKGGLTMIN